MPMRLGSGADRTTHGGGLALNIVLPDVLHGHTSGVGMLAHAAGLRIDTDGGSVLACVDRVRAVALGDVGFMTREALNLVRLHPRHGLRSGVAQLANRARLDGRRGDADNGAIFAPNDLVRATPVGEAIRGAAGAGRQDLPILVGGADRDIRGGGAVCDGGSRCGTAGEGKENGGGGGEADGNHDCVCVMLELDTVFRRDC